MKSEIESNHLKIIVAGDVVVDWYFWTRYSDPKDETQYSWQLFSGQNMQPKLGGAILLSKMLKSMCNENILIHDQMPTKYENQPNLWESNLFNDPNKAIIQILKLDLFPDWKLNSKDQVYRIKKFYGSATPKINNGDNETYNPDPLEIVNDFEDADFVLIHDAGNGFRTTENKWPKAIKGKKNPFIIYNMNLPLFEGKLWKHIINSHKNKLILILNADDLRELGANISRSISWEKTAIDFLWVINKNGIFSAIKDLNVIVRFGLEGVIHYRKIKGKVVAKLYFDPASVEGGFWDSKKFGLMKGIAIAFTSSLASILINHDNEEISDENYEDGIKFGLSKTREFLSKGHGYDVGNNAKHNPKIFGGIYDDSSMSQKEDDIEMMGHIECVELSPKILSNGKQDPLFWSILTDKTENNNQELEDVAKEIVKKGAIALKHYPVGHFGKLITVDRAEIESYRSIKNIMNGYINSEKVTRPLSIAVFGYPGSGKSFGITQIAQTIDPKNIYNMNFNVSQFTSTKDLSNAFHRIRDISLKGKIPLVFFDEFDCEFKGQSLGWLRYFLAPMQDGEFMDYGIMHPIGKSIFVFAGGLFENFQQFCEKTGVNPNKQDVSCNNHISVSNARFSDKCPDFVSRLRGYVNILGPNKINDKDYAHIIRRAILLRSLIEQSIPNIIKEENNSQIRIFSNGINGTANIEDNLLHFLLTVKGYTHGARSMEAIIDMSRLRITNSWTMSSLPPNDQLKLHIKGEFPIY
jgi:hypothetical protein